MCGICGAISLRGEAVPGLERRLEVMNELISHRGPDDSGLWMHERGHVGLGHRRLSIIDLEHGHQPMTDPAGRWITYNGEVYNYPELMRELGGDFRTSCDTEVVLRAHDRWGIDSLHRLRGMFAHAIWDEPAQELVCARDRFGIKPFYYAVVDDVFYFASEAKALLPMLPSIETDLDGLKDYLAFQFCLAGKTLFKGVRELPPGHVLRIRRGAATPQRYWEVYYEVDFDAHGGYFEERIEHLLAESVRLHMRSDVPVSAYLSGGVDSSAVASLAGRRAGRPRRLHGEVLRGPPLRRVRLCAPARHAAGPGSARGGHRRRGLHRQHRERRLPHGLSRGRPGLLPSVHGLPGRRGAGEGDPRGSGRRRDLRRLHPLSDRLLRAVHQGRDRRDAARRQLRRHLRVDHPEPGRAPELQADAAGLLAEGPVRGSRRPLLPADQPLAPHRARGRRPRRWATTRRSRPSRRSSTARTSGTRPTSTR